MFRKLFLLAALAAILTSTSFAGTISTYGGSNATFPFGNGFERCLLWWTLSPGTDRLVTKVWTYTNNTQTDLVMFVTFWGTRDISQGAGFSVTANELGTVRVPLSGQSTGGSVWINTGDISSAGIVLPDFFGVEVEYDVAGTLVRGNPANYTTGYIKISSGMTGGTLNDDFYTDANYNGMLENDIASDLWYRSSVPGHAPCIEITTAPAPSGATFTGTVNLLGWMGASLPSVNVVVDGGAPVATALTAVDTDTGTFTVSLPATGSHSVKVKAAVTLSQTQSGTTPALVSGTFNLQCGDNNNDNVIDDFDFNNVITNFGSGAGGDGNGDAATDDFDFNLVITNFGSTGS
jgi:hypothetical protein